MSPHDTAYRPTVAPAEQTNTAARPTTPQSRAPGDRGPASLGQVVGPYALWERIGRGGLGDVYRAYHTQTGAEVALKLLRAGGDASPAELRSLQREVEAARRLSHPNILPILDAGEHDGQPYYAMPLVAGGSLAKRMPELDTRAGVALLAKVTRAMGYAHSRGVVHRDLKPANVLLGPGGEPLVADFGLARFLDHSSVHTRTGPVFGSLPYMAPEQAAGKGHRATAATDVWALGVMLYELLGGARPFQGDSTLDLLHQIQHADPPSLRQARAGVPRDLEAACRRCLRKRQYERYASAGELAEDLERWLRGEPISRHESTLPFVGRARVRPSLVAVALAAVWAALVFGLFAFAGAGRPGERSRPGSLAWLEEAERQAKPGQPTSLVAGGKPGWHRVVTARDDTSPVAWRPRQPLDVFTRGACYLEFLPPRPGRPPYRLRVKVRQNDLNDGARVGLYFGRREHALAKLTLHTAGEVTFSEARADRDGNLLVVALRSLALAKGVPVIHDHQQSSAGGRLPAGQFWLGKGPWRSFTIEVTEGAVRIAGADPRAVARFADLDEEFAFSARRHRPEFRGVAPALSPAGGAGLFVLNTSAEVQELTVEFLGR